MIGKRKTGKMLEFILGSWCVVGFAFSHLGGWLLSDSVAAAVATISSAANSFLLQTIHTKFAAASYMFFATSIPIMVLLTKVFASLKFGAVSIFNRLLFVLLLVLLVSVFYFYGVSIELDRKGAIGSIYRLYYSQELGVVLVHFLLAMGIYVVSLLVLSGDGEAK